ncbi:hypothetical protein GBAR_LOCUS3543, partial [Geodia barretti]
HRFSYQGQSLTRPVTTCKIWPNRNTYNLPNWSQQRCETASQRLSISVSDISCANGMPFTRQYCGSGYVSQSLPIAKAVTSFTETPTRFAI